jgi:hypothetical protein
MKPYKTMLFCSTPNYITLNCFFWKKKLELVWKVSHQLSLGQWWQCFVFSPIKLGVSSNKKNKRMMLLFMCLFSTKNKRHKHVLC